MASRELTVMLISLIMLTSHPEGQILRPQSCRRAPVIPNFNIPLYLGRWYEVRRYFPIAFELNLVCGTASYTQNFDGSINVVNRAVNRLTKRFQSVTGKGDVVTNAKLNVNFGAQNTQNFGTSPEGNYWVLETDYISYAVVYSCLEYFATLAFEIVWILGRTPTLPDLLLNNIYANLTRQGIDTRPLDSHPDIQGTREINCADYPHYGFP